MNREEIKDFLARDLERLRTVNTGSGGSLVVRPVPSVIQNRDDGDAGGGGVAVMKGLSGGAWGVDQDADDQARDMKEEEEYDDEIQLTQSTHSFLFTEDICSLPFLFALTIVGMSYACLILALLDNLEESSSDNRLGVPVQVGYQVRTAQYLGLVIGLLMEEEIPTTLYLLRMIPRNSLREKLPKVEYYKFLFSALVRMAMGYMFYMNMFVVVAQATGVIDIFYDVLALQFVQQLDDICFTLSTMDVFGKRLKHASKKKYFRTDFDRVPFKRRRKMTVFMKVLYFINLILMMAGMVLVSLNQSRGKYHADSITVTFGNDVWENAYVKVSPDGNKGTNTTNGYDEMVLVYSWFNGVYKREGMHDRRPVYVEQNKFDHSAYETTIPAEIKYCKSEGAWVVTHSVISKSRTDDEVSLLVSIQCRSTCHRDTNDLFRAKTDCPWILKSQPTSEFDLFEVPENWLIWIGTVSNSAQLSLTDNQCQDSIDCNYHGQCIDGSCVCNDGGGEVFYLGTHCEQAITCVALIGDWGDTWSIVPIADTLWSIYDRPIFVYNGGLEAVNITVPKNDVLTLQYSGSRWYGMSFEGLQNRSDEEWVAVSLEPFGELWPMREPRELAIVIVTGSRQGSGFYSCNYTVKDLMRDIPPEES
eukprot:scaffold13320_cov215-Alexandrium_tamarense.AAC.5